jgi:hypothetical protein
MAYGKCVTVLGFLFLADRSSSIFILLSLLTFLSFSFSFFLVYLFFLCLSLTPSLSLPLSPFFLSSTLSISRYNTTPVAHVIFEFNSRKSAVMSPAHCLISLIKGTLPDRN